MTPVRTADAVATRKGLANRLLIPLLHSTAGHRLGRRLAVVEYAGRRTGQRHELVVLYRAQGRTVHIDVGMADHKTWWRNFETRHPLSLHLAGAGHDASASLVRAGDRVTVIADLEGSAVATDQEAT